MRKFDYRAPRFPVDLPVWLTLADTTQAARCKEISTEGMKIELSAPLHDGALGTAELSYESLSLKLPFRVAHAERESGAVEFICETKAQRNAIGGLVACLTSPQPCRSLAIVS